MKNKLTLFIVIFIFTFSALIFGYFIRDFLRVDKYKQTSNIKDIIVKDPLKKYQIENLQNFDFVPGELTIENSNLNFSKDIESYLFYFKFDSDLDKKLDKQTSGLINLPKKDGKYPIILMNRGYVDQKIYTTGMGTKNSSIYFSENGFMTIAPDFLGYANSDSEAGNIFESRFQTYVTSVTLLKNIEEGKLPDKLINLWDGKNIFIWGHSNGGQISITLAEITKTKRPIVLWAPVTKNFPYSILYYTDESEDRGKLIRKELSKFEEVYDTDKFSLSQYLDSIKAKILLFQGGNDDSVPEEWSREFVTQMKNIDKDIILKYYPSSDHNLATNWNDAVKSTIDFFNENKVE